jgi:predicted Zn-dependent protease
MTGSTTASTTATSLAAALILKSRGPDTVDDRPRFLSEADCRDLLRRLARVATGGGVTTVIVNSHWRGGTRWGRNQVTTSSEVNTNDILVVRNVNGAAGWEWINDTTDVALVASARRAERLVTLNAERPNFDLVAELPLEPAAGLALFSNATYQLTAAARAAAALKSIGQAKTAGLLSAGYIEVAAVGIGAFDTLGRVRYFPYTQARYSVTVRTPTGNGSGWAGIDHHDWGKIDAATLTATALDKCLKSQNPVRVEPGRYTTILEPQAVGDFVGQLFLCWPDAMARSTNGQRNLGPFFLSEGRTKLGLEIVDERITIRTNPSDPDLGYPPFDPFGNEFWNDPFVFPVYHPTTWIERGVLTELAYDRTYAISTLRKNTGLPDPRSFHMSGGDTTIEEMIATTKRGLLVTRFDQIMLLDLTSQLYRGYTRDGLWLIEDGKISKPVKNLAFTESVLFALNRVDSLGVPQRVFHPGEFLPAQPIPQPVVVPPLKISDFSFTSLSDAV